MTTSSPYKGHGGGHHHSEVNLQGLGGHFNTSTSHIQLSRSASSCLSHIDLARSEAAGENVGGHATIMTTTTEDEPEINNSLAAIGSTRSLYNSQKSKMSVVGQTCTECQFRAFIIAVLWSEGL